MNITDFNIRVLATTALEKHQKFLESTLEKVAAAAKEGNFNFTGFCQRNEYEALRIAVEIDGCKICKLQQNMDGRVIFNIYWGNGNASE